MQPHKRYYFTQLVQLCAISFTPNGGQAMRWLCDDPPDPTKTPQLSEIEQEWVLFSTEVRLCPVFGKPPVVAVG